MTAEALPRPRPRPHGTPTARGRLERLLDEGSFIEFELFLPQGASPRTDGVVTGAGTVHGRSVFVYAQDFRILGGALRPAHAAKIHKVMDLALTAGAPLIALTDSGAARIADGVTPLAAYGGIFRRHVRASGAIPQISIVCGPCSGAAAYAPALTDFVFTVPGIPGIPGPPPEFSTEPAVGTFTYLDEKSCLPDVRQLVSLLPASSHDLPPAVRTFDPADPSEPPDPSDRSCPRLLDIVLASPRQPYDMRAVLTEITDHGEFLELPAGWGRTIVCALARFGGRTAGIVANQSLARAGLLDVDAVQQAARFVQFCDAFDIPLVTLVDVPGFPAGRPGSGPEHHGITRHDARLLYAYCDATVPRVQVILRQACGGACIVTDSRSVGADLSLTWPLVDAGHADQLVADVIDPADTRAVISRALDLLSARRPRRAGRKHGNPPA